METTVSYSLEIKDEYRCFYDTVDVYQEAVSFLVSVVSENCGSIESAGNQQYKQRAVEKLVHATEGNEARYKAFDIRFHSFPATSGGAPYQPHWGLLRATGEIWSSGKSLAGNAKSQG